MYYRVLAGDWIAKQEQETRDKACKFDFSQYSKIWDLIKHVNCKLSSLKGTAKQKLKILGRKNDKSCFEM